MRSTARVTGVSINTVAQLLAQIGSFCIGYHNQMVRNVPAKRVQCDEIWSYIYCKESNVPYSMKGRAGDAWTWIAFDADTKLIISWLVGDRTIDSGRPFMLDLARRVSGKIQLSTDGLHAYPEAVELAFGAKVDYGLITKKYGQEMNYQRRYSPSSPKEVKKSVLCGFPDWEYISTSLIERQNLTLRMSNRRFTRLTNAFSKKLLNHKYALALHFVYYNFCRIHSAIRVTPAMEAGLTKDILEIEDLINLADE